MWQSCSQVGGRPVKIWAALSGGCRPHRAWHVCDFGTRCLGAQRSPALQRCIPHAGLHRDWKEAALAETHTATEQSAQRLPHVAHVPHGSAGTAPAPWRPSSCSRLPRPPPGLPLPLTPACPEAGSAQRRPSGGCPKPPPSRTSTPGTPPVQASPSQPAQGRGAPSVAHPAVPPTPFPRPAPDAHSRHPTSPGIPHFPRIPAQGRASPTERVPLTSSSPRPAPTLGTPPLPPPPPSPESLLSFLPQLC